MITSFGELLKALDTAENLTDGNMALGPCINPTAQSTCHSRITDKGAMHKLTRTDLESKLCDACMIHYYVSTARAHAYTFQSKQTWIAAQPQTGGAK